MRSVGRVTVEIGRPTSARLGCLVLFVGASFIGLATTMSNAAATDTSSDAYTILRRLPGGAEIRAYAAPTATAPATKLVVAVPVVGPFVQSTIDANGAALVEALSADGNLRPASDELRPWSARGVHYGMVYWRRTQGEVLVDVLESRKGPSEAQLREARLISRSSKLPHVPSWVPPATLCLVFLMTTLCGGAARSRVGVKLAAPHDD